MGCVPRGVCLAAARSLGAVQAVEAWRQAPYGSRPQSICVTMGGRARVLAWLRSSLDRLLGLRLGFNRGERLIAQFAQDVVGAAAELARDREAGAVVVDPACDLEVPPLPPPLARRLGRIGQMRPVAGPLDLLDHEAPTGRPLQRKLGLTTRKLLKPLAHRSTRRGRDPAPPNLTRLAVERLVRDLP